MDPLSLTASIIAVLQMTATLASYLSDVKHATSEQRRVAVEASNLYGLLISLRYRVEDARADDPWFNQVKMLGTTQGPLDQYKDVLEKIVSQITPTGKRERLKAALAWRWTKTEVDDALQRMERLKTLITIALSNDTFRLAQAIHDGVGELITQTATIHLDVQQIKAQTGRDLHDRLSKWLQVPDPSSNYQAALAKRHPNTGSWLLQSSQLQQWRRSASSFMWLHGNAGCGKTILRYVSAHANLVFEPAAKLNDDSAAALQNIYDDTSREPGAAVIYFYFDFNDANKQQSDRAIRSLLLQLAQQIPDCLRALEQAYQKCNNGQTQPSQDTVRSMLMDGFALPNRKFVVLDALDECTDRPSLLPFLRNLVTSPQHEVHLLATSRRERDIEEELKEVADYPTNIQSTEVDRDINVYVRDRLASDTRFKKWKPVIKDEITNELASKANGMFRWAYCQLESLRLCTSPNSIRKALNSLPRTLDETYTRIIHQLEAQGYLSDATTILQWLCFANRPLRLLEVVEVLAIHNGEHGVFDPDDRLSDPEDVMMICSSLVSCHRDRQRNMLDQLDRGGIDILEIESHSDEDGFNDDTSDGTILIPSLPDGLQTSFGHRPLRLSEVRLAHFSIKEYLLSDRSCIQSSLVPQKCHDVIAKSCLQYLLHVRIEDDVDIEGPPLTQIIWQKYPLVRYASRNWCYHVQHAGSKVSTATVELWQELLTSETNMLNWIDCYDPDDAWMDHIMLRNQTDIAPPLYYVSLLGLTCAVSFLLDQGANVNAVGGASGTALTAAVENGHEQVVEELVAFGANVNAVGGRAAPALTAAVQSSYEAIVVRLLAAGADVNASNTGHFPALIEAVRHDHERIVERLLAAGADVNVEHFDTALMAAAQLGNKQMVGKLVEAGARVIADSSGPCTALMVAATLGNEQIVQQLLAAGAHVDIVGGEYGTALIAAAGGGHEQVVEKLLAAGADVNLTVQDHDPALILASLGGHEQAVERMLMAGADVEASGTWGDTALIEASGYGHEKIVERLLTAGADIETIGYSGRTPLIYASSNGHEQVVEQLLAAGANVDAHNDRRDTALTIAARLGYDGIVQRLLTAGADVNVPNELSCTALSEAYRHGHERVIQRLLAAGARHDEMICPEHQNLTDIEPLTTMVVSSSESILPNAG